MALNNTLTGPSAPAPWAREIRAGTVGAVATLAVPLTLGLLAFAPTGVHAAALGMPAVFSGVALGGLVMALFGRSVLPCAGPSSATTLILTAFVAQLVADPALGLSQPEDRAQLLALVACCVMLSGAVQCLLALLRLGHLARYVPQPVLAGFMTGVALLIMLAQLPLLLGLGPGQPLSALAGLHALPSPLPLLLGALAAATVWLGAPRLPRLPMALVGLLAATGLGLALHAAVPAWGTALPVGELPAELPLLEALLPLASPATQALARAHLQGLLLTALLLALVGSLESALSARAVDQVLNTRHDPSRELLATGLANLASGAVGGLPIVYLRLRALATLRDGGRSWRAALVGALVLGLMYLLARPALALLPLAALAGIMVTIGLSLMDTWALSLLRQALRGERSGELLRELAVVAVVGGVTLTLGFVPAVALGMVIASLAFVRSMNRSLLRHRGTALARPSRRMYPARHAAALAQARRRIEVLEVEGALFFGNVEKLLDEAASRAADCAFVVLDLQRVASLDASGAVGLQQLTRQLQREGVTVLLSGINDGRGHARALRALGGFDADAQAHWYEDIDRAVEAAERVLLQAQGLVLDGQVVPLEGCALLSGLDEAQRRRLQPLLQRRELSAGEWLFREGDPGDRLYVLSAGSVSVLAAASQPDGLRKRLASLSPGMTLGETALLDGGGRSGDGRADSASVVYELHADALARLERDDPEVAARLHRNLALHLSQRLRDASTSWRADSA